MRQVHITRTIAMLMAVSMFTTLATPADAAGFGSRLRGLWSSDDSSAPSTPSTSAAGNSTAAPRVASRQTRTTFAPSPLAPQPSVTMPAPTSPTGSLPTAARNDSPAWGSRIWSAMDSTKEALTFKPREVPAPDPVRLDNKPENVEAPVFVSAARVYEAQGRLREAREYYDKALAADAKNLDALVGLARLKHREGDLVAATEMYQRALRAHPGNAVVLNDLGLCYARRQMLQQAQQSIAEAVKKDPTSKLYRNNLALVLVEMNREDEAFAQLAAVHGEAVAHYNVAYLLREKGQADAAAEHLQAALQLDNRMESARIMLAQLNPGPQGNPPYDTRLGNPNIERQGPPTQATPVVNQQRPWGYENNQPNVQLPVSHRQEAPANNVPPNGQTYPGANYGAPVTNPPASGPANVGPVRVRFENGQPSDYRGGPAGGAPVTSAPQYDTNYSPAPQNNQPAYDTNYRQAPLPEAAPEYLRGAAAQPATQPTAQPMSQPATQGLQQPGQYQPYEYQPQQYQPQQSQPAPTSGGSRWTTGR